MAAKLHLGTRSGFIVGSFLGAQRRSVEPGQPRSLCADCQPQHSGWVPGTARGPLPSTRGAGALPNSLVFGAAVLIARIGVLWGVKRNSPDQMGRPRSEFAAQLRRSAMRRCAASGRRDHGPLPAQPPPAARDRGRTADRPRKGRSRRLIRHRTPPVMIPDPLAPRDPRSSLNRCARSAPPGGLANWRQLAFDP